MIENNYLKKEIDRLMSLKGGVIGEVFKTHAVYIRHREGEKGVKAVEEKLTELGYPFKFKEIVPLEWYPEGLGVSIILIAKKIFDWTDEDVFDMGNSAPKYSFIVKTFIQHFISPERMLNESQKYWHRHFDFGKVEIVEFNKEKKRLIMRVIGYKFHPIICKFHAGYLLRIAQFVLNSKKIDIKETKCVHEGDPYHEYLVTWE